MDLGDWLGDTRNSTEGYGGHPMKVFIHRRQPGKVVALLRDAGFEVETQMLFHRDGRVAQACLFARREP